MTESSRVRATLIGVVIVALFATLLARLWYLQVMAGDAFAAQAEANRVVEVPVEAPRGRILDRQGRVLVDDRVSNVVAVSRSGVGNERSAVLERLEGVLGLPARELADRLDDKRASQYRPVRVASEVPEDTLVFIREHQELFPGVDAVQTPVRRYGGGSLAAHVLGYVGEINDKELEARPGYEPGDRIGKTGVEAAFEEHLRGEPGVERLEIDRGGRVVRVLRLKEPRKGADLRLTIDLDAQRLAEESLAQGIEAARLGWDDEMKKHFLAPAGSVVVLDPRDGSVVAMASCPTFQPGDFTGGISTAQWNELTDPANHYPLNNRAVQGEYAPGSTFKLISALAGLRSGVLTPNTTLEDEGKIRIGDTTKRNARSKAYGRVDLRRALSVSSDVYFYSLGFRIWQLRGEDAEGIQQVARDFGFGEDTGIDLGSERSGRVPDERWKRRAHEEHPEVFVDGVWRPGDNVNLAVGQGEMVSTPLQLANAYSAFANGGTLWVPRLADAVLDERGREAKSFEPDPKAQVTLPGGHRDAVMAGLRGAIVDEEGTAGPAFAGFPNQAVRVAGKTGTAQVSRRQDTSLFAAVVPYDSPRYVLVAVVEEGGFGSAVAAPIVRRVIEGLMALEVRPVDVITGEVD